MKKQSIYLFLSVLTIIIASCSKDEPETIQAIVKSSAKQITSFVFKAADNDALVEDVTAVLNETNKTISATVANGTDIISLTPAIVVSDKASIAPNGSKDFSSPVTYTITAEDGTKVTYNITVLIAPNDAKTILSFVFKAEDNNALTEDLETTIDEETKLITATVPYGTNITELTPVITLSEAATITPSGIQNFTSVVKYEVSAEDTSVASYDVKVNVTANNEKQILGFGFSLTENPIAINIIGSIDEDAKTITFDTPLGANYSALLPNLIVSPGATVTPAGPQDFTRPVEYEVIAADGSTAVYTVRLSDRSVLLALYHANPNNTFNWNLDDPDTSRWEGVTHDAGKNIIGLSFANKSLEIIPLEIGNLTNLTTLSFRNNNLTEISTAIVNLINLTSLALSDNNLTSIPREIGNLTSLIALDLRDNILTSIPREIGNLPNLGRLNLVNNNLTRIPREIGNLANLTKLFLSENDLVSLPLELGDLSNLDILYLQDNNLTSIPREIGNLTNLTQLILNNNNLTRIPLEIGNLTNLTNLRLHGNNLAEIPKEIGNLTNLASLHLYDNNLVEIPKELGNLSNLKFLHLSSNSLSGIPPVMGNLTNLIELSLGNNNLTEIPKEIGNLINLTTLDLRDNKLTSLPKEIGNLSSLTGLNLSGNQLTSIPSDLGNLTSLISLSLNENKLTSIPEEIGNLTTLTRLNLTANLLTSIPQEVCKLEDTGTIIQLDPGVKCE